MVTQWLASTTAALSLSVAQRHRHVISWTCGCLKRLRYCPLCIELVITGGFAVKERVSLALARSESLRAVSTNNVVIHCCARWPLHGHCADTTGTSSSQHTESMLRHHTLCKANRIAGNERQLSVGTESSGSLTPPRRKLITSRSLDEKVRRIEQFL